ncbi:MAG TPA: hypothetical protein VNV83_01925 [Acidimicrobiales bacterium]|nr:hypothetical protein [Acidimicrobiales bacterium]
MADELTTAMAAPLEGPVPLDRGAWRAARGAAQSTLAGLAVRRAGAGPFRVTDHDVRVALGTGAVEADDAPFAWSTRTARRTIGLAAVRSLLAAEARTPHDAVQARLADSEREVRDGGRTVSQLDRWVAALPDAGRSAVAAEAVTWATRLWCALDWPALGLPLVVGRDHWWDSPHSALLALRGRADVRTRAAHLVVLSGPRRESVRAELALVALVEALRARADAEPAPGRVVGWWPDSGHIVRLEPHPSVLALAADAVALVLAGGSPTRIAAA